VPPIYRKYSYKHSKYLDCDWVDEVQPAYRCSWETAGLGHNMTRTYYQPDSGFSADGAWVVELSLDRKLLVVLRSSIMIKLPVNSALHHAHECLLPETPFERRLRHSRGRIPFHKQSDRQFVKDTLVCAVCAKQQKLWRWTEFKSQLSCSTSYMYLHSVAQQQLLSPTMQINAYGANATKGLLVCNKPYSSVTCKDLISLIS